MLLFVSNQPLSLKKMKDITGKSPKEIRGLIDLIQDEYKKNDRSFFIQEVAEGFSFATKPEFSPWIKKLYNNDKKVKLTKASIEVLAIVAYNQPVTRMDIEKIRGVDCTNILLNLLKISFIKVSGRKKVPGNPLLYQVTENFLIHFGLKNLSDLPPINELGLQQNDYGKTE